MTTDNRTNEPNQNETKSGQEFCFTEAQVEAAVNAAWERQEFHRGPGGQVVEAPGPVFRHIIESALVAAAGATPVLPSSTVDEDAEDLRYLAARARELRQRVAISPMAAERIADRLAGKEKNEC